MSKQMESGEGAGDMNFGGGGSVGVVGAVSGAAIAIGVPVAVLALGQNLGPTVQTILVCTALVIGGGVSVISSFFGLVMPRRIPGHLTNPRHWREFVREAQAGKRRHGPRSHWDEAE